VTAAPTLVALRALGLGDLLTAVPALRALATAFPDHRRVLAAPRALAPLALLTRSVDELVHTRPLEPLDARLDGADVAINLHGRGPESHRLLMQVRPARLVAFAQAEAGFHSGPRWLPGEHEVVRWCRMLSESGIPADPRRLDLDPPPFAVPDWLEGATVVHPGAASAARRWPVERFAAVVRAEVADGRRVAVTGTFEEAALAREVARLAGLPPDAVLAGRTRLHELACVVANAGTLVCGDTGVSHLATAFGTPSVVLFGPVPPSEWGPPPERRSHRALWAGRRGDPHADCPDPGLLAIGVEDVLEALAALPRGSAASGSGQVGTTTVLP
jgi:ADP-heptose:LPS heptosyltransferase